jgi:hypothetical protein
MRALLLSCIAGCGSPDARTVSEVVDIAPLVKGGFGIPARRNFIGVYRPGTAEWLLRMTRPGWIDEGPPDVVFRYGFPGDKPLVGDWDGNGTETQGVFRAGAWLLTNTLGAPNADIGFAYGNAGDIPLVGDWDGNGTATPGIYRGGFFHLRNSNSNGPADFIFAFRDPNPAYIPLSGDWNGDGVDTVGLYEPSNVRFYLTNSTVGATTDVDVQFGNPTDQPIMGDWNGDGVPTLGIKRGSEWFLNNDFVPDEGATDDGLYTSFGSFGDVPIVGNWDPNATKGYSTAPASLGDFFPLGVDFQPSSSFAKWKSRGINTVIRQPSPWAPYAESIETWTAAANQLGLRMIRDARPNPDDDDGETNLLAWITFDEPEGLAFSHTEVRLRYQRLKTYNSRPVFVNFNGAVLLPAIDGVCGGPGDISTLGRQALTCYPRFIDTEDWVSMDYYPVNFQVSPSRPHPNLATIGQIIDKLTRWSSGKPQFAYLEASLMHVGSSHRPPTAGEFRAQIWSAIIHGARGIFYFPHDVATPGNPDAAPEHIVSEMIIQNARVTELAPILQSTINPEPIGFRGSAPLEAAWRRYGNHDYYIVLNLSLAPVTKTMTVTGFVPSHPFTVLGEDRVVGQGGNASFVDTFGPYEAHVYRH